MGGRCHVYQCLHFIDFIACLILCSEVDRSSLQREVIAAQSGNLLMRPEL